MRIILATPLYPPDIAEPAPYIKELARRMSAAHAVTILAYGHIPETVPGVRILTINKYLPLPVRLIGYTFALLSATLRADVLLFENGPSVALPAALVSYCTRARFVMHMGDRVAHERATSDVRLARLERFASRRSHSVVSEIPQARPEIQPFSAPPVAELEAYERSWDTHVALLQHHFTYA